MKKRVSSKLFVFLMALCSVLMTFTSTAAADEEPILGSGNGDGNEGSIISHVSIKADGCQLRLCEVGKYINGTYVLDEKYADCGADMTNLAEASAAQAAAEKLAEAASKTEDGQTDIVLGGSCSFMVPIDESRVYVLFQVSGFVNAVISPALIVVPYTDDSGDVVVNVNLELKYEIKEIKGSVILNKYALGGKSLEGAVFDLEKVDEDDALGGELPYSKVVTGLVSDKNGQIIVTDLPKGKYRFVEVKAPEGFKINTEGAEFTIVDSGMVKLADGIYVADDDNVAVCSVIDEPVEESSKEESSHTEISIDAPSGPESSLPKPDDPPVITGEDIAKFTIIGVVFGVTLVAIVLLVILGKKKKSDDDDDDE